MYIYIYIFLFLCTVPVAVPENFMAIVTSSSSATFSWLPPPMEYQNGVIVQYYVDITNTGLGISFLVIVPGSHTSLEYAVLKPFTTYQCSVASATNVGLGPYTNKINVTTSEAGKQILSGKLQT